MSEQEPRVAVVIGAGIVGICTALALQEKGFSVTVVDPQGPSEGTSYGNAGVISPWSCVPQSIPGLWKNVPRWLLDPQGPLAIRWTHFPFLLPGLLRFLLAGRLHRLPDIATAMLAVNRPSVAHYRRLLAGTGTEDLLRDCNYLHVYRHIDGADPHSLSWRLREEFGVPLEVLRGGAVQEMEPELSPDFQSAMAIKQQGRTLNPGRLGQVLAHKAMGLGVEFLPHQVHAIVPLTEGGYRIDTDQTAITTRTLVVAAGVWSARLLAALGVRAPLEAERGYHLMFRDPGISLNHSVMDSQYKFVTSSMEGGVRSAGAAEYAGLDAAPDYRRAEIFKALASGLFPNLNTDSSEAWMGSRSSTPDSLPYIGQVSGYVGLFCAFGHGHLGLTGAPETGRLVAALANGENPDIDLEPYSLARFKG